MAEETYALEDERKRTDITGLRATLKEEEADVQTSREKGLDLVNEMFMATRTFAIHASDNKATEYPIQRLVTTIRSLIESIGTAQFIVAEGESYINDVRIRVEARNYSNLQHVVHLMDGHALGGITFSRSLSVEHARALVIALNERPDPDKPKTETWLPVINTPAYRYKYQKIFYQEMKILCNRLKIPFIDACSPFLNTDGYLDLQYRNPKDKYHLHSDLKSWYFDWLDQYFGFVSSEPFETTKGNGKWDGSYPHFEQLMKREIQRLSRNGKDIDYEHLMTSGAIDSLAVIEIIHLLETMFEVEIDLGSIRKTDYESLSGMYTKFIAGS